MEHPKEEATFLMVKPDGVIRGLTGEIITRVEKAGLKIVGLKMFVPTKEQVDKHYPKDESWIDRLGQKTKATYEKYDKDMMTELGTDQTMEVGKMVRSWLMDYLTMGPVVAMSVKGVHAVDMVRKIVGHTMPFKAERGTVRGDFSVDSPVSANAEKRAVFNLMHASETQDEAKHEFEHWFGNKEPIWDYERSDEMVMYPNSKKK